MDATTTTNIESLLSRDEWIQIFLFLPVYDLCQLSLAHSTFYRFINNNNNNNKEEDQQHVDHYTSSLWSQLLTRDFTSDEVRQYEELVHLYSQQQQKQKHKQNHGSSGTIASKLQQSTTAEHVKTEQRHLLCESMRQYRALHAEFRYFGFVRVPDRSHFGENEPQEVFKVLFGVTNHQMNVSVTNLLIDRVWQPVDKPIFSLGVDFSVLRLKSKRVSERPHLTLQLWTAAQGPERFRTISRAYYRATQTMILVVDPLHSRQDTSRYNNTLDIALDRLRDMETMLNMGPPKACRGVFVVAVGTWPNDTPISKDQFLEQCAQMFTLLPIEYYEITEQNAIAVGDHLVRRLCQFHKRTFEEDGSQPLKEMAPPSSRSKCTVS